MLGGVEKVMYDLTAGLSPRGVHCDMLCASAGVPPGEVKVNANASVTICPTMAKFSGTMLSPSMIGEVRRRRDKYDLIHVHHPDPMAALSLFLSGYKGKVVLHWHSDIQKSPLLMAMYKPLQSWLIRRADKIIGTTPAYLSASPYLRKVQDKTECIPIGIAPVQPDAAGAAEIRKTYEGKKIVFTMGRLVPYKGYGCLIDSDKISRVSHNLFSCTGSRCRAEQLGYMQRNASRPSFRVIRFTCDCSRRTIPPSGTFLSI